MPRATIGTMGFALQWTPTIPPKAQKVLQAKKPNEIVGFDLTPALGSVPSLLVKDLRQSGIQLPEHWGDTNEVFPIVPEIAFYITYDLPNGMAVSFAMKGVNLRTGLVELEELTDTPCQSYWPTRKPWIDGYATENRQGVRQFVFLRGAEAIAKFDVAKAVGVKETDSLIDAISATFFLPTDLSKLESDRYGGYRGGVAFEATLGGLESYSMSKSVTRGGGGHRHVEEVGVGAGAVMRQTHEENRAFKASDFAKTFVMRLVSRLVWVDQFNEWAMQIGSDPVRPQTIRYMQDQQRRYEIGLWGMLGGEPVETNVKNLPEIA